MVDNELQFVDNNNVVNADKLRCLPSTYLLLNFLPLDKVARIL
ncbi:MAG: hypothetical protein NZ928_01940 [Endomicrobia bacterium]|nr:hypothetical protein [Endomicrobiia bacterium]MDW8056525.1 hypothetical protein [Elusimicrobiota bacterium]